MATANERAEVSFDDVCLDEKSCKDSTRNGTANKLERDSNQPMEIVIPERAKWSKKIDFILSAVGYAVGFGNVWRFPYLCYSNGGGAFLIPYFVMMVFAGLPLFYLELALGQYASLGPISVWKVCPIFAGLGYTMVGLNLLVSIYYNVILALSIFYFIASFAKTLPWADCGNEWNKRCTFDGEEPNAGNATQAFLSLKSTTPFLSNVSEDYDNCAGPLCRTLAPVDAGSAPANVFGGNYSAKSPAEEYWLYYVLGVDDTTNIAHIGMPRWHLTLCHLLAWIIVLLCIIRGIKYSGKVVYFTATFPYVVLLVLFIRGVTLPGALEGIKFYVVPDFSKMASVKVWNDAAIQILFSLGPGFGSLIMLGSYNNFHNRCDRDAVAVTLVNCFTSVFAGFVIFSVLGFMSVKRGLAVKDVVEKGPGLAFTAYPEALAMMPGAPFWSICFFFMLFTLGLDSQFVGVESILTGLMDEFPIVSKWKKISAVILCIILFLAGLPCVTQGAMYVVELIDQFTTSFPLLIVVLLETIAIMWVYGVRRFSKDIEVMFGEKPNYYWLGCWTFVTPTIVLFIFIFKCLEYKGLYFGLYRYPAWAEGMGWIIVSVLIGIIPLLGVFKFLRCIGSCQKFGWVLSGAAPLAIWKLNKLWHPDPSWGPSDYEDPTNNYVTRKSPTKAITDDAAFSASYHDGHCFLPTAEPKDDQMLFRNVVCSNSQTADANNFTSKVPEASKNDQLGFSNSSEHESSTKFPLKLQNHLISVLSFSNVSSQDLSRNPELSKIFGDGVQNAEKQNVGEPIPGDVGKEMNVAVGGDVLLSVAMDLGHNDELSNNNHSEFLTESHI